MVRWAHLRYCNPKTLRPFRIQGVHIDPWWLCVCRGPGCFLRGAVKCIPVRSWSGYVPFPRPLLSGDRLTVHDKHRTTVHSFGYQWWPGRWPIPTPLQHNKLICGRACHCLPLNASISNLFISYKVHVFPFYSFIFLLGFIHLYHSKTNLKRRDNTMFTLMLCRVE